MINRNALINHDTSATAKLRERGGGGEGKERERERERTDSLGDAARHPRAPN